MIDNIKIIIKNTFVNDINRAMSLVDSLLLNSSSRSSDFIFIKNRLIVLQDEKSRGTLTFDEIQRASNQIAASFFHFVDRLHLEDLDTKKTGQILRKEGINTKKRGNVSEYTVSFKNLSNSTKKEIYEIIDFYKYNLNNGNLDDEIYFNMGLCYLHLKLFDLSKKYFEKALELAPDNADYHYYLSLANIRNRRPFTLMPNDIRIIEQYINSAMEIDNTQSKYYILLVILKYDYYCLNGLDVPPPAINELTTNLNGKKNDVYEIQRLKESVPISDSKLIQFVNQFK